MAYDYGSSTSASDKGEMMWDLRNTRAFLISGCLFDAFDGQKDRDFIKWYNSLKNAHTWAVHQFSYKEDDETFEDIEKAAIGVFNKYPAVFQQGKGDSRAVGEIQNALDRLQKFLLFKMNQANMFGSKYYEEA